MIQCIWVWLMNFIKLCVVIVVYIMSYILKVIRLHLTKEEMDEEFEKILEERPTLAELCQHIHIVNKWQEFGTILELDPKTLDAIAQKPRDDTYKTLKMFQMWLNTNPHATRRQVIDALKSTFIQENALAYEYEETLRQLYISISEYIRLITLLEYIHINTRK